MVTEGRPNASFGAESVAYRPGPGTVLVTSTAVVLLGPEVEVPSAIGLWNGVQSSGSLQELVDAVMTIGLRNLPSLGVVYRSSTELRLLLRGTVRAKATVAADTVEMLSAVRAVTWLERTVQGPVDLLLDGESDSGAQLPLVEGIGAAGSVAVAWIASSSKANGAEVGELWTPVEPAPEGSELTPPAKSEPDVQSTLMVSDFPGLDGGSVPSEPEADQYAGSAMLDRPSSDFGSVPPAAEPPDDDFEDLFGATRQPLPVERAAVRQVEADDAAHPLPGDAPPGGAGSSTTGNADPPPGLQALTAPVPEEPAAASTFAPPRSRPPIGAPVPPPPAGSGGLILGVPGMPPGPGTAERTRAEGPTGRDDQTSVVPLGESPFVGSEGSTGSPTPPVGPEDDLSNMTMTRAQLKKMMTPNDQAATLTGASVQGVWCPSGHPNPPAATNCRICGAGLGEADPVSMPRPLLGRLLFSNGTEVKLDRPVIVGRLPKAERVSARELPQLITVPSPDKDISRNHVEVRIDGWHVLVVDLESTNGTVVTIPGQPPERLRSGEEQPIVPGTVVTIADEVTFVYEATG
jgi:hypothetical protein